ncbi:hypothetical protein B0H10DRAFT_2228989 [Mycena sp. CBHHK59/15]|nr:hypothetical protein B0H10DRAFT_2228989 [Mycena sp. CBHHK59/15]
MSRGISDQRSLAYESEASRLTRDSGTAPCQWKGTRFTFIVNIHVLVDSIVVDRGQTDDSGQWRGTKLPPVEALESRRKLDLNTAQEIEMSLRTGILSNPNNDISHRMSRNSRRQAATAEKEQESRDAAKPKAKASSTPNLAQCFSPIPSGISWEISVKV